MQALEDWDQQEEREAQLELEISPNHMLDEDDNEEEDETQLDLSAKTILAKRRARHGTMSSDTDDDDEEVEEVDPRKDNNWESQEDIVKYNSQAAPQRLKTPMPTWMRTNFVPGAALLPPLAPGRGRSAVEEVTGEKENMESQSEPLTLPSQMPGKSWPHMGKLVGMPILVSLLRAVDEIRCTSELSASNSDNPKGNRWARLFDHCCGQIIDVEADEVPRGLLGGHLAVLPNASKLKAKIASVWAYVNKEALKPRSKIPLDVIGLCSRQNDEMEETKRKDKEASKKAKDRDAALQEQMRQYQRGVGARPPSAKGTVGSGRREHSTNLYVDEPATYSYANASRRSETPTLSGNATATATAGTPTVRGGGRRGSSSSKSSGSGTKGSSSMQASAMTDLTGFTRRFNTICDKHFGGSEDDVSSLDESVNKRRRLLEVKKNHMETIQFLRPLKEDSDKASQAFDMALDDLFEVNKQIKELDKSLTG